MTRAIALLAAAPCGDLISEAFWIAGETRSLENVDLDMSSLLACFRGIVVASRN
jgi:hypothetical protein